MQYCTVHILHHEREERRNSIRMRRHPRMQCVCYPSTIYTGHALRHLSICAAVPIAHRISIELHGQSWIVRVTRSLLLFLGYRFSVRMYVRSKHNGEFGAAAVPYTLFFFWLKLI